MKTLSLILAALLLTSNAYAEPGILTNQREVVNESAIDDGDNATDPVYCTSANYANLKNPTLLIYVDYVSGTSTTFDLTIYEATDSDATNWITLYTASQASTDEYYKLKLTDGALRCFKFDRTIGGTSPVYNFNVQFLYQSR